MYHILVQVARPYSETCAHYSAPEGAIRQGILESLPNTTNRVKKYRQIILLFPDLRYLEAMEAVDFLLQPLCSF